MADINQFIVAVNTALSEGEFGLKQLLDSRITGLIFGKEYVDNIDAYIRRASPESAFVNTSGFSAKVPQGGEVPLGFIRTEKFPITLQRHADARAYEETRYGRFSDYERQVQDLAVDSAAANVALSVDLDIANVLKGNDTSNIYAGSNVTNIASNAEWDQYGAGASDPVGQLRAMRVKTGADNLLLSYDVATALTLHPQITNFGAGGTGNAVVGTDFLSERLKALIPGLRNVYILDGSFVNSVPVSLAPSIGLAVTEVAFMWRSGTVKEIIVEGHELNVMAYYENSRKCVVFQAEQVSKLAFFSPWSVGYFTNILK